MKKKIFITGVVRDYDSADQQRLADEIKDYICQNIVGPDCADYVKVIIDEPDDKTVRIRFPFSPGWTPNPGWMSREMYRCFTGEHSGFTAENTVWWTMGFGPDYPMEVSFSIDDVIECHKKNTRFYKANRYKNITIEETSAELEVNITF